MTLSKKLFIGFGSLIVFTSLVAAAPSPDTATKPKPAVLSETVTKNSPSPTIAATPTPTPAPIATPVPTPAPTVAPAATSSGPGYTNVDGNHISSPVHADTAPAGATARCVDGTYSFSAHRSGTCSHHGGVSVWL